MRKSVSVQGESTLVGSEIEDLYFYPIDAAKIGGFVFTAPLRFFSFFTLHWVLLWVGLAGFALWRLLPAMGPCGRDYLVLVAFWGGLNFAYLAWFFGRRRSHRLMESSLRKQGSSS